MAKEKGSSAFDEVTGTTDSNTNTDTDSDSETPASSEASGNNQSNGDTGSGNEHSSPEKDGGESPTADETATTVGDSTPGFPFKSITQRPIYVSDEAWENYDDLRFDILTELRSTYSIKNAETRELDEALLTVIREEIDAADIARQLVKHRGFNPDDEQN